MWISELREHFLQRGYGKQQLNSDIQPALDTPKEACLQPQQNQDKPACTPLVVTYMYHSALPTFPSTTKHHLSILQSLERLQRALPLPLLIVFHHLRNLKDLLV